jgi:hypothetical protein
MEKAMRRFNNLTSRLNLENLNERCLPSANSVSMVSPHEVSYTPALVAENAQNDSVLRKHDTTESEIKLEPEGVERKH